MTLEEALATIKAVEQRLYNLWREADQAGKPREELRDLGRALEGVIAEWGELGRALAPKVLAGVEATLQREPVTGMYNILHRLPKDHDPCAGHPLRIEGYKELPDEVDVCVRIVEVP